MNIYFPIDEKVDKGATRRGIFAQDYGGAFVIKKIQGEREGFLVCLLAGWQSGSGKASLLLRNLMNIYFPE